MIDRFTFFSSYYEALRPLPDEDRLLLYDAIFDYAFQGEETQEMTVYSKSLFTLLKPHIDSSIQYRQKQSENGAKGGRPKSQNKPNENPNESQDNPNKNINKNKNMNMNMNENTTGEKTARVSVPYEKIKNLYNEICVSFPKCTKLSEARKKAIRARFSSGMTEDDFRTLFEKAEASDFLKGKNNNHWKASFDWLICDANMTKTIDGNYDNKNGGDQNGTTERMGQAFQNFGITV